MKLIPCLLTLFFLATSCSNRKNIKEQTNIKRDQLTQILDSMVVLDQLAYKASLKGIHSDSIRSLQDSVYSSNCKLANQIMNKFGFPGFDLVGEKGSYNFYLIIQHCYSNVEFQKLVLREMKEEVKANNADKKHFAYLTDKVRTNSNELQVYGTQLDFDTDKGIAFPKSLEDPDNVNARRADIGMEPLEEYLDKATNQHREMNRERYEKMGILEPKTEK